MLSSLPAGCDAGMNCLTPGRPYISAGSMIVTAAGGRVRAAVSGIKRVDRPRDNPVLLRVKPGVELDQGPVSVRVDTELMSRGKSEPVLELLGQWQQQFVPSSGGPQLRHQHHPAAAIQADAERSGIRRETDAHGVVHQALTGQLQQQPAGWQPQGYPTRAVLLTQPHQRHAGSRLFYS